MISYTKTKALPLQHAHLIAIYICIYERKTKGRAKRVITKQIGENFSKKTNKNVMRCYNQTNIHGNSLFWHLFKKIFTGRSKVLASISFAKRENDKNGLKRIFRLRLLVVRASSVISIDKNSIILRSQLVATCSKKPLYSRNLALAEFLFW